MRNNESAYQDARRYQAAHPGVSYTRAKRITQATANPRSDRRPLEAWFAGVDGCQTRVSFEWLDRLGSDPVRGIGRGPHALLVGAGAASLLPALADALAAGQDEHDIEIVYSTAEPPTYRIESQHIEVAHRDLADHVAERLAARSELLRQMGALDIEDLRTAGTRLPTVVVLIERPEESLIPQLVHWARVGRCLGVDFVVAGESAADAVAAKLDDEAYSATLGEAGPPMARLLLSGMFPLVMSVPAVGRAALLCDSRGAASAAARVYTPGEARFPHARTTFAEFMFDPPRS